MSATPALLDATRARLAHRPPTTVNVREALRCVRGTAPSSTLVAEVRAALAADREVSLAAS